MKKPLSKQTGIIEETIDGVVEWVTFHNPVPLFVFQFILKMVYSISG